MADARAASAWSHRFRGAIGRRRPSSARCGRTVSSRLARSTARINGETFRAWVEQFLVPELKQGDIVILDNLPSHKVEGVRTAIENAGARLLYLPSYSPDLNPIEQWFAKLKTLLRKAAARTFDALIHAIASALQTFTPDECANYLANSGYRRQ
jgi:transposase